MMLEKMSRIIDVPCKVNLTLYVGDRLDNGYHNLHSIFIPLHSPSDKMEILIGESSFERLEIHCDSKDILSKQNTIAKAYTAFCEASGMDDLHAKVTLKKGIPVGAGLGGGSSDAAAFLGVLKDILSRDGIEKKVNFNEIASKVGADVPFFMQSPTIEPCIAEGIGDILHPIPELIDIFRDWTILVCCPKIAVSTAWSYRQLDKKREAVMTRNFFNKKIIKKNISESLTRKIKLYKYNCPCENGSGNQKLPFCLRNDFEDVVFEAYPEIARLKQFLLDSGAEDAVMSGSGSSVVALFLPGFSQIDAIVANLNERQIETYVNIGIQN